MQDGQFAADFAAAVGAKLGLAAADRVVIEGLAPGSVAVEFAVVLAMAGAALPATDDTATAIWRITTQRIPTGIGWGGG